MVRSSITKMRSDEMPPNEGEGAKPLKKEERDLCLFLLT